MARTALRKLVDHAVDEACKLSNSENSPSNDTCDDQLFENEKSPLSGRNYDDLLKMIIANKVVINILFELNKNFHKIFETYKLLKKIIILRFYYLEIYYICF
jgi:hypothetical protein